ncbi:MAG: hypothetical protein ACK4FV_05840 [Candidatus Nitrosocaldus sp.]
MSRYRRFIAIDETKLKEEYVYVWLVCTRYEYDEGVTAIGLILEEWP